MKCVGERQPALRSVVSREPSWNGARSTTLAAVALIALATAAPAESENPLDAPAAARQITVAVPSDYPPLYSLDRNGKPAGFAVDMLDALARRTGLRVNYLVVGTFREALEAIRTKRADLIPGISINPERRAEFAFSELVETVPVVCFVRADNEDIREIGDLTRGYRIAVIEQSAVMAELQTQNDLKIVVCNDPETALFHLLAGEVDAFVHPEAALVSAARHVGMDDRIKTVGLPIMQLQRAYLMRKDDQDLAALLNPAISSFKRSEEYANLISKWYSGPTPFWTVPRLLGAMSLLLASCAVVFMIWRNVSVTRINRRLMESIAQRKHVEDALRDSEAKYRLLIENQEDLIIKLDPEFRLTFVSPNYCRTLGKSEAELLHQSCLCWIHNEDRAQVMDSLRRTLTPPYAVAHEERALTQDGWRWFGWVAKGVPDVGGTVREIVGVGSDITQRKQAEEALRDSEARLASLLRAAPTGIGLLEQHTLRQINEHLARMLGCRPADLLGQPLVRLFRSTAEYEAAWREIQRQLEHNEIATVDACWRRWNGESLNVMLSASLVEQSHDPAVYTLAALDVTEWNKAREDRTKLEAQLRQAQKMEAVGQLAGGVAHDFNNILTAVLGNLELSINAIKTRFGDAAVLETLHQAEHSAERAAGLTRQLLAFSRRQVTQPRVIDMNRILSELGKMLRRLITEDIVLSMELDKELRRIKADPGQIEQVVINLVVNARDAMPYGGKLILETRNVELDETYASMHAEVQPGPYVQLAVSDTGCGMDEQTVERIFEPFFTTKGAGEGTGLGLSTVYGIVKQAGGHIVVYSEPWQGTTFKIYLPVMPAEAEQNGEDVNKLAAPVGAETILLCEDDPLVRRLARQFLYNAGYTVLAAADGAEALELVEHFNGAIHLLVTDVIMPDTNGRELADRLRATKPDLRILFVSGYTSNIIAHHGVLEEGVEFLEKPFSRADLLRRVREVLDARPAAQAAR